MSIDATVAAVHFNENGGGKLKLVDRTKDGKAVGIAGQSVLFFDEAPEEVSALNGCDIWGGDSSLHLGEKTIALRLSVTRIQFVPRERFLAAIEAYRK